jgi:hypothetical protein
MGRQATYGTLSQVDDDTVEFVVDGQIQRAWRVSPPLTGMAELVQRCLGALGQEGWRPISHHGNDSRAIVLARVPYTAGAKLATYGTLRFQPGGDLVLTVGGASMQRWSSGGIDSDTLSRAISELEPRGWRLHRRYRRGATVVRG